MRNGFHKGMVYLGWGWLICCPFPVAAVCQAPESGQQAPAVRSGERSQGAKIVFRHLEHDFDTLSFKGKPAVYDFVFANEGTAPLVVLRTEVACKCIRVEYPKEPVYPAGQGTIRVTYDPRKERGPFTKGIQVYTNAGNGRIVLVVRGNVR